MTLILISHNLAVVDHLADNVVMYLGRIVEYGRTDDVFRSPGHPYTAALLASALAPRPRMTLPDMRLGTEFPSAIDVPPDCDFHPRCPRIGAHCAMTDPLESADRAHRFSCHHPQPLLHAEEPAT